MLPADSGGEWIHHSTASGCSCCWSRRWRGSEILPFDAVFMPFASERIGKFEVTVPQNRDSWKAADYSMFAYNSPHFLHEWTHKMNRQGCLLRIYGFDIHGTYSAFPPMVQTDLFVGILPSLVVVNHPHIQMIVHILYAMVKSSIIRWWPSIH